jgi:LacI family transcriptional regulator
MKINTKVIAEKAGVSTATVSRVLNDYDGVRDITRKKVLKVINKYDYEINAIAKSLKQKRTNTIGIVIGNVLSQFYSIIAGSIEETASKNGFNTILCNANYNLKKELNYLRILQSNRVDGIILTPIGKNADYVNGLVRKGTKIVLLDRLIDGVLCDVVKVDNINGAYTATKHLIEQGFQKIGIINGSLDNTTGRDRLEGYKKAFKEFDMKIDNNLIKIGDFKKESGYRLAGEITESKPDAVFVANLDMTLGVTLCLKEKKIRIPDDVAIVGFDDAEWTVLLDKPLTVIQQPVKELAVTAAEILIKKIKDNGSNKKPVTRILDTNLVVRESSLKKVD